MYYKIEKDLVIAGAENAWVLGNEDKIVKGSEFELPLSYLRYDGHNIIDVRTQNKFFIDEQGIKHITRFVGAWQYLECEYTDELIRENSQWRIKNNEDKCQERIEEIKSKRRQAYTTEADPLKNEYDYDLISNPAEAETKKLQWLAKVKEIKARYPFSS
ncbi:hypothetical protein [Spartinivicinus poritis]|uniref:Uncharacterized protein n=1 Tax=Spartinivicinus poritis TaxID=2994640 RepID=A0ABT5UG76_9GAMM|nr:hypothetical protein [Spartinivicinus sp. A2-2]MDE1465381.1 hypothetical protein [Spartinivicinus sp. A2-2]